MCKKTSSLITSVIKSSACVSITVSYFLHLGLDATPILRDEITEHRYSLGIFHQSMSYRMEQIYNSHGVSTVTTPTGQETGVLCCRRLRLPVYSITFGFSPYSADDLLPPTLIIIMWTGCESCNDHPADGGSCTHHAHKSHSVLTSAHRQLSVLPYLDCTPPIYCFPMIDAPSAIKNRHHRKLHDSKWTHSMSLFSGGFKGQRGFKTSYQHKSSPCPSEAAHSTGGINYRFNRTVGSLLKICSPLYHYYFVALAL